MSRATDARRSAGRGEVWLVDFGGASGAETQGKRPAVVVSPDRLNGRVRTVIVVPLTRTRRAWPWRVDTTFARTAGQAATDQVRARDRTMLDRRLGRLDPAELDAVLAKLREMFTP